MHNFFTKKYEEMCDLCRRGVVFKSSAKFSKLFRPVELHFNVAVFRHVITKLYKSLMAKMIICNAKGFQINKYNMILLCKLGNITEYIYIFLLFMK